METFSDSEIIRLIRENQRDRALKMMVMKHATDCLPLIRSKTRNLDRYELLSVMYHAFLDFCDRVDRKEYTYRDDASFLSYFKTACVNQAREFNRAVDLPDIVLLPEILELVKDDAREAEEAARKEFLEEKRAAYGIELDLETEEETDLMDEVVRLFHKLNDKCKFLLVLKFFLNMSHREIADALRLFFEIGNENVSKSELHRCIERMKAQAVLPGG